MPNDPEGDEQRDRFVELLAEADRRAQPVDFWWRDDDAETVTPALDRLLELARRHALPLALAVIPKRATVELADRLSVEPKVVALQHGWSHRNHAPDEAKSMELGDHRPLAAVTSDLRNGFERLTALMPEKFLPVLVPPWNRISKAVRDARTEIGLAGLSTSGPAPGNPHWVNVHIDIFEWRQARRPLTRAEVYARLAEELDRRLAGQREPLGIMTHHLVHEEASWGFLDEVFQLAANHPAVRWPSIEELFRLGDAGPNCIEGSSAP